MPHPLVEMNEKYLNAMSALYQSTKDWKENSAQFKTGLDEDRAMDVWEQIEEARRLHREGLLEG